MMVDPLAMILQRPRQQQQNIQALNSHNADFGNFTIEHVDNAGSEENPETLLLIEEKSQLSTVAEDDILEIGIEANDLNSLLEQFEETEATLQSAAESLTTPLLSSANNGPAEASSAANSPLKNVKKTLSKKETHALQDIISDGGERGCHSLPGSRSGSPTPHPSSRLEAKLPGFNYLNLEHDYCTDKKGATNNNNAEEKKVIELLAQENLEQINNAKNARANKAKDPVAAKAAANERKQLYKKRQYRLKKKGSDTNTPEGSEQGDSNLPTPMTSPTRESSNTPSGTSPNTSPTRSSSFITPNASPCMSKAATQSSSSVQERRLQYFDKIPDYFPTKLFSMYQEIGSTDQAEKDDKDPTVIVFKNTSPAGSQMQRYSRTPSPDGRPRQRYSSYSSYSSRSCSSRSRSRSHSRSYSRSRSRSLSHSRNSRSPSISRSRSSQRARSHHSRSSVHSPSPQRLRDRSRKKLRRKRLRRNSHRSGSGYSSHMRSRSRSRLRSRSRSRSRRSSRRALRRRRRRDSNQRQESYRRRSRSREQEREWKKQRWDEQMEEQKKQWEDRRVIYVGRIEDSCTKEYLCRRFGQFGEIDKVTVHFRDEGDNYAFVTFQYTCDAFAAIEGVNQDKFEPQYDVCFGGRRQFCRSDYADLDSMNQEEKAMEFGYQETDEVHRADEPVSKETDFDILLKQAMKNAKKR
ncbi:uncharacterized protein [Amphiura filiformis]|uniref:uncharacterized protein n=1 Tax=Amphiura filiformis TaxID=82378 RepID=UPI003B21BD31